MKGGQCGIIMFDLTARITYKHVPNWHRGLTRVCDNIPIVLVGNKADVKDRKVTAKSITFHRKKNLPYYDMSVRLNVNTEKPFLWISRKIARDSQLVFVEPAILQPPVIHVDKEQIAQMQKDFQAASDEADPFCQQHYSGVRNIVRNITEGKKKWVENWMTENYLQDYITTLIEAGFDTQKKFLSLQVKLGLTHYTTHNLRSPHRKNIETILCQYGITKPGHLKRAIKAIRALKRRRITESWFFDQTLVRKYSTEIVDTCYDEKASSTSSTSSPSSPSSPSPSAQKNWVKNFFLNKCFFPESALESVLDAGFDIRSSIINMTSEDLFICGITETAHVLRVCENIRELEREKWRRHNPDCDTDDEEEHQRYVAKQEKKNNPNFVDPQHSEFKLSDYAMKLFDEGDGNASVVDRSVDPSEFVLKSTRSLSPIEIAIMNNEDMKVEVSGFEDCDPKLFLGSIEKAYQLTNYTWDNDFHQHEAMKWAFILAFTKRPRPIQTSGVGFLGQQRFLKIILNYFERPYIGQCFKDGTSNIKRFVEGRANIMFGDYSIKVLNQVHPSIEGCSVDAMLILDDILQHTLQSLANHAVTFATKNKQSILDEFDENLLATIPLTIIASRRSNTEFFVVTLDPGQNGGNFSQVEQQVDDNHMMTMEVEENTTEPNNNNGSWETKQTILIKLSNNNRGNDILEKWYNLAPEFKKNISPDIVSMLNVPVASATRQSSGILAPWEINFNCLITCSAIQKAICLVFPRELKKHALSEIDKKLKKFTTGENSLVFSYKMVGFLLSKITGLISHTNASFCLAAVMEYLCAECVELSGNAATDLKVPVILPRHVLLAIHNDEELNKMCSKMRIVGGGVLPNIHLCHLPRKNNYRNYIAMWATRKEMLLELTGCFGFMKSTAGEEDKDNIKILQSFVYQSEKEKRNDKNEDETLEQVNLHYSNIHNLGKYLDNFKQSIRRLAARAGVVGFSNEMTYVFESLFNISCFYIEKIFCDAITFTNHKNEIKISPTHVLQALRKDAHPFFAGLGTDQLKQIHSEWLKDNNARSSSTTNLSNNKEQKCWALDAQTNMKKFRKEMKETKENFKSNEWMDYTLSSESKEENILKNVRDALLYNNEYDPYGEVYSSSPRNQFLSHDIIGAYYKHSLQMIRQMQTTSQRCFSKECIIKICDLIKTKIREDQGDNITFVDNDPSIYIMIDEMYECYLLEIMEAANLIAINGGRKFVNVNDIDLVRRLRKPTKW